MKNLARQYDETKKKSDQPKKDEVKFVRGAKVRGGGVEEKGKTVGKFV
jgi:hypothetical protein